MRHFALPFQRAVHRQQACTQKFTTLSLGEVAPDDDVDVASLVFKREEGDAARGTGALAVEDEAGCAYKTAVWQAAQLGSGDQPVTLKAAAQ